MPETVMALANGAGFGYLDWTVVALYVVLVMGIGVWAAHGQKGKRDYFLGGRKLPWWVVGASIVATETSALTFIGVPAYVLGALMIENGTFSFAGGNMLFMMIVIGYVTGRVIVAFWVVPYYFKGEVYTTYQLIRRAFGYKTNYVIAGFSLVGMTLAAGVRVLVTAIPLMVVMRTVWPDWTLAYSIVLIMAVALIYTAMGGIKAVVWTDMAQYFVFIFGGLFALFYIPRLLVGDLAAPSGAEGWSAIGEVAGGDSVLQWFHLGLLSPSAVADQLNGEVTVLSFLWAQIVEIFAGNFSLIMGLIAAPVGIVFAFGFDQLNVQRVLGCRNQRDGQKAVLLSAFLIVPQFLLFLMVGAGLYTFYTLNNFDFGGIPPWDPATLGEPGPFTQHVYDIVTAASPEMAATLSEPTGVGNPVADYVFPIFIVDQIPVVAKGFLIAGILAAAMSSVSSALSAMASMLVMDFYRPIMNIRGETRGELYISRVAVIVCGAGLTLVAIGSRGVEFLFDFAFTLAGLTTGGILGAFIFALIYKRGYPGPVIAGMVSSIIFMTIFYFLRETTDLAMAWPWHPLVGMTVSFGVAWLASLGLPEPTDRRSVEDAEDDE